LPLAALALADGVRKKGGETKNLLIANPRFIIVFACELLWCFRLSAHILRRHTVEDFRFAKIRDRLSRNGPCWMHIDFLIQLFLP
jgi:steroid 5-alpha reductase family enzyme